MILVRVIRFIFQGIGFFSVLGAVITVGLLFWAAEWLEVHDTPHKADYIVPLAGNDHRLMTAAKLYREGYAPTVMLSRAEILPKTRVELLEIELGAPDYKPYEFERLVLNHGSVPDLSIEEFGHGHVSTVEEAEALAEYLNGRKVSLLLVTSPTHARRAKTIFQDVLDEDEVLVVTTPEGEPRKPWWKHQQSAKDIVLELAKTAYYLMGGRFRADLRNQDSAVVTPAVDSK